MKKNTGWNLAIQDAQEAITALERKIKRLRESIEVFQQSRDEGRPWPGDKELEVQRELASL